MSTTAVLIIIAVAYLGWFGLVAFAAWLLGE
jgi:hypothetical protein